jgi:dTDP-4-dehydrorhamnose reductase
LNILVLGAGGQLGRCLKKVSFDKKVTNINFPNESDGNILDNSALEALFQRVSPQYVVNCAAYTAVDKAEDEIELCRKINKDGATNIAKLCKQYGAIMVHVSTDFVFKGSVPELMNEDSIADPVNVYGITKLEGEVEITNILQEYFILRTSWLYSEYGNNFVKTMLKLGVDRKELSVIVDQIGTPTYAIDLAAAILEIIASRKNEYGIYHYSNEGVTSWYDFAVAVFALSKNPIQVMPILTSEYPTRAIRPKFTVMDKGKIKRTFNLRVPYWRDSLELCIRNLGLDS